MSESETFASLMRAARKNRGLTQEKLAQKIGRTLSTIVRWERNEGEPKASDAKAIADALGVDLNDLIPK